MTLLGYNPEWLTLGFLTPDFLRAQAAEYRAGRDAHLEHYHWAAYRCVLDTVDFGDKQRWRDFIRLVEADPDDHLFRGALAELLDTDRVPPEWFTEYVDERPRFLSIPNLQRKIATAQQRRLGK